MVEKFLQRFEVARDVFGDMTTFLIHLRLKLGIVYLNKNVVVLMALYLVLLIQSLENGE